MNLSTQETAMCAKKCQEELFFLQASASTITTVARDVKMSRPELTAVQVAGDGGMGEEEVVEVGVLLEWRYISSSALP